MKRYRFAIFLLLISFCTLLSVAAETTEKTEFSWSENVQDDYGYRHLESCEKATGLTQLYLDMQKDAEKFASGTADRNLEKGFIGSYAYGAYGLTFHEATSVWNMLKNDNPQYYWLDTRIYYTSTRIYLSVGEEYLSASERERCDALIAEKRKYYLERISNCKTDFEKALILHDEIIRNVDYSYKDASDINGGRLSSHTIMGVFSGSGAVCEGYAKAYQYLLNCAGIENIYVVGKGSGEDHAWNLLFLEGKWYWCDITWNDTGNNEEMSYKYFLLERSVFENDHIPFSVDDEGLYYSYPLPQAEDFSGTEMVLFEDGREVGRYGTLSGALQVCTSEFSIYEILIRNDIGYKHFALPPTLPKAIQIRLRSENNGYIVLSGEISVQSDLVFDNVMLNAFEEGILNAPNHRIHLEGARFVGGYAVASETDCMTFVTKELYVNTDAYFFDLCLNVLQAYVGEHSKMYFYSQKAEIVSLALAETAVLYANDNYKKVSLYIGDLVVNSNSADIHFISGKKGVYVTIHHIIGGWTDFHVFCSDWVYYPEIHVTGNADMGVRLNLMGSGVVSDDMAVIYSKKMDAIKVLITLDGIDITSNYTKRASDGAFVRVTDMEAVKKMLSLNALLSYRDGMLLGIAPNMTVDMLSLCMYCKELKAIDMFGNEISEESYVGTGFLLAVTDFSDNSYLFVAVVTGDVNGDGVVNDTDSTLIRNAYFDIETLKTPFFFSADVNHNGRIDSNDYMKILHTTILRNLAEG